jgi:hypothetical protein
MIFVSYVIANALVTQVQTGPITATAIVGAPVKEVWQAYTSSEGIRSWMVASGTVDLRLNGLMRTSYKKGSDLTGNDVIENKIISLDSERMITIQCTKTPENFPFKGALMKAWTVLYFEPIGKAKTKVTCRMLGFDESKESQQCRNFFEKGNQTELNELVKYFAKH